MKFTLLLCSLFCSYTLGRCVVTIDQTQYNVRRWKEHHPGGAGVLRCDTDITDMFTKVHTVGILEDKIQDGTIERIENSMSCTNVSRNDTKVSKKLHPLIDRALNRIHAHHIVQSNAFTEWFRAGSATDDELRAFIVQFSVFSNLFLVAQLQRVINAPDLNDMHEAKEILLNELGVVYNNGDSDYTKLVETRGTVEGGIYHHRASHFEWLVDIAHTFDLNFASIGKREHGSSTTLHFCDALYTYYGSDDPNVAIGASFAIENWANSGFWDDLVDGFTQINNRRKIPLGFWIHHQQLEQQHAEHTVHELEKAIDKNRITDEAVFMNAIDQMLDATAIFWNGLL